MPSKGDTTTVVALLPQKESKDSWCLLGGYVTTLGNFKQIVDFYKTREEARKAKKSLKIFLGKRLLQLQLRRADWQDEYRATILPKVFY